MIIALLSATVFVPMGECIASQIETATRRILMIVNKSGLSARLIAVQNPDWLLQTGQQIQALDYELHAAIRTIGKGEMRPDHIPAFMNASGKRDQLMARVISYLAEQSKRPEYHSGAERTAKPEG